MGYSNLQFGYWSRDPSDPNNPVDKSNLGLIYPNNSLREPAMADNCIKCDVAIVGSGFAGALIANELSRKGIKRRYSRGRPRRSAEHQQLLKRFYKADIKVPESPYPPELSDSSGNLRNPANVAAGRPTVQTLGASNWKDPQQAYLVQKGPRPFTSTYERVAGGTSHWLGSSPRFVPNDFRMKTSYGKNQSNFPLPDWPIAISSENMSAYYEKAES